MKTNDQVDKEFDGKFVVECPTGKNKGKMVLNPIYPEKILDFIHSLRQSDRNTLIEEIVTETAKQLEMTILLGEQLNEPDWPSRIRAFKNQYLLALIKGKGGKL